MDPVRENWLDLTREAAIDPAQPICDPHHHLWTHRGRYLLDEFLRDATGGHNVVSSVFVACDSHYRDWGPPELRPVGETEFVEAIAAKSATERTTPVVAAGIVGFADLTLGSGVMPVLEAHLAASPTRFRGIRHSVTWDPHPGVKSMAPHLRPKIMAEPGFRAGFECLRKLDLAYDCWLFHHQLPEVVPLAREFPDVPIVVNHIGGPLGTGPYAGRRAEVFETWKRAIDAVAACRNVVMKLGGGGMPRTGFEFEARATPPGSVELAELTRPYYRHCIERLGPDRCMFESNFPSDKVSYSYNVVWNSFKRMTGDLSESERNALFHDTAVRVYRLGAPGGGSRAR